MCRTSLPNLRAFDGGIAATTTSRESSSAEIRCRCICRPDTDVKDLKLPATCKYSDMKTHGLRRCPKVRFGCETFDVIEVVATCGSMSTSRSSYTRSYVDCYRSNTNASSLMLRCHHSLSVNDLRNK